MSSLLGMISFAAFFYLIDYASRLLRPVSILASVANNGLMVIERVFPFLANGRESLKCGLEAFGTPSRAISHNGTSAIVLAVNLRTLIIVAERSNSVVEFVPQVGDFVAEGEPLFNLYGGVDNIDDSVARDTVVFGSERTMEQDPTFAIRLVVDIALRALSAAINDPTTAVLAIDQLHRMLRSIGKHDLNTGEFFGQSRQLCAILRTP